MVAARGEATEPVPFKNIAGKDKRVPLGHPGWKRPGA